MSSKPALMAKLAEYLGIENVPEPTTLDEQFRLAMWEVFIDGEETGTYLSVAIDAPIMMSLDRLYCEMTYSILDRNLAMAVIAAIQGKDVAIRNG